MMSEKTKVMLVAAIPAVVGVVAILCKLLMGVN